MDAQLLIVLKLAAFFEWLSAWYGVESRKQLIGVFHKIIADGNGVQIAEQIAES